nr:histidine--tRNA ligase, cytoplasmic [Tanacetum cinerariifolium]
MLDICGVPSNKFRFVCSSIDKLDKQMFEQIKKELIDENGLNTETVEKIGSFVKLRGHPFELLLELKKEGSQGLDYYTGVIYEAITKGATQVGSIAGGGRYDDLIGTFRSKPFVAASVSLGIDRVFAIMEQNQKDDKQIVRACETQVLVSIFGEDLSLAAKLVNKCWCANLKASFLVNKRVSKHFDRAKEFGIPWIVMLGEQETSRGVVTLKNKDTGVEKKFESGGVSGSGGCEDEEEGADHQDDEDEDGNGDA